jgi:hypothetical protein
MRQERSPNECRDCAALFRGIKKTQYARGLGAEILSELRGYSQPKLRAIGTRPRWCAGELIPVNRSFNHFISNATIGSTRDAPESCSVGPVRFVLSFDKSKSQFPALQAVLA